MQAYGKLEELNKRYEELSIELAKPEVIGDPLQLRKFSKEQSDLDEIIKAYRSLTSTLNQIRDLEEMIENESDAELVGMAREDLAALKERQVEIENNLNVLLLPKDPNDDKNVFLEIRAGTGGEEASLILGGEEVKGPVRRFRGLEQPLQRALEFRGGHVAQFGRFPRGGFEKSCWVAAVDCAEKPRGFMVGRAFRANRSFVGEHLEEPAPLFLRG